MRFAQFILKDYQTMKCIIKKTMIYCKYNGLIRVVCSGCV